MVDTALGPATAGPALLDPSVRSRVALDWHRRCPLRIPPWLALRYRARRLPDATVQSRRRMTPGHVAFLSGDKVPGSTQARLVGLSRRYRPAIRPSRLIAGARLVIQARCGSTRRNPAPRTVSTYRMPPGFARPISAKSAPPMIEGPC